MNKGNVKALYFHSIKMMELCKDIASNLGIFTDEEIVICGFIGLFHDIGTFSNRNKLLLSLEEAEDYSKKSVNILFDSEKLIREITDDTRYDDVIKISIYCHNKNGLPSGLSDKMLHFCKILKDAHIIDTFRLSIKYPYLDLRIDSFPSDLVYNTFKQYRVINSRVSDNNADNVLIILSNVFGVSYHYSYVLLKQEACVDKFIRAIDVSNKAFMKFFNQIGAVLNMYIDRKIVG